MNLLRVLDLLSVRASPGYIPACQWEVRGNLREMEVVNLTEKFGLFEDHWSPRVVGELNGQLVKLAKLKGEFVWHSHADEDEMFLVVKGEFKMKFREHEALVKAGEFLVVPRGVEHCPVAEEECHLMLFEPAETKHTGEVVSDRTATHQPRI